MSVATNTLEVDGDQFKPNMMRVASGGGIMLGSDSDAVTAALAMRASKKLAGRTLHLSVQATDVRGRRQVEPLAGTLTVKN
jgi:hypothetical protein